MSDTNESEEGCFVNIAMPGDTAPETQALAQQLMKVVGDSDAHPAECGRALVCVMCAVFATSSHDMDELLERLYAEIEILLIANRREIAARKEAD